MKRFLMCILLITSVLFSFTGCSVADVEALSDGAEVMSVSEERTLSNDWKTFEFQVEDGIYNLPISSNQILGLTNTKFVEENGDFLRYDLNDDMLLCVKLKNKPIMMLELQEDVFTSDINKDSLAVSVGQTAEQAEDGKLKIIFPGGTYAGQKITWDALRRLYGEPDVTTDYYSEVEYKWALSEDSESNYLQIYLKGNEFINEISMNYSKPVDKSADAEK